MNNEHGERPRPDLKEAMAQSVKLLLEQNSELSQRVVNALKNGRLDEIPAEIIAALHMTEELSRTSRTILEAQGQVIFRKESLAEPAPATTEEGPLTSLLKTKIDSLLPLGQSSIGRNELVSVVGNHVGVERIINELGISKNTERFSREQATEITYKFLTRLTGNVQQRHQYSRTDLLRTFTVHASHLMNGVRLRVLIGQIILQLILKQPGRLGDCPSLKKLFPEEKKQVHKVILYKSKRCN